jgi:hypothetical protein
MLLGLRDGLQRRHWSSLELGFRWLRPIEIIREREEIGWWWWTPRVSIGGGSHLIGFRGRRRASWRGQATGGRHRAASADPEVEDDGSPCGSRLSYNEPVWGLGWLVVGPAKWVVAR